MIEFKLNKYKFHSIMITPRIIPLVKQNRVKEVNAD